MDKKSKRCDSCVGNGKILGLGNIKVPCKVCNAVGFVNSSELESESPKSKKKKEENGN